MADGVRQIYFMFVTGILLCCVNAAKLAEFSSSSSSVFEAGPFSVGKLSIPPWGEDPLKPLVIAVPSVEREYPVIIFLHDFFPIRNYFYWQLLQHLASYGYIVVAPQMYEITGWDTTQEMLDLESITTFLSRGGLKSFLPPFLSNITPNMTKVIIAGHGRGAKVAFAIAMGKSPSSSSFNFTALIAFDPVDGTGTRQTTPALLTQSANSFSGLNIPTLIVGTGLGSAVYRLFPTCAPVQFGPAEFFNETCGARAPTYYFVAPEYGHHDFLSDGVEWVSCMLCNCTVPVEPMRRFAAGIAVAFLQDMVDGDSLVMAEVFNDPSIAPVKLETPKFKLENCSSVEFYGFGMM